MTFNEMATIPVQNIYRAALVSETRGVRVLKEMIARGDISPTRTPTGRVLVCPVDGEKIFESLAS